MGKFTLKSSLIAIIESLLQIRTVFFNKFRISRIGGIFSEFIGQAADPHHLPVFNHAD